MTTDNFLKAAGFGVGILYMLIGSVVLLLLLIVGFWEGFQRLGFTFSFLIIAVYVYGTAAFAFYTGSRPTIQKGAFLFILILPAIWLGINSYQQEVSIKNLAATYATSDDSEKVKNAARQLLERGKRAGADPAVQTLLKHLKEAGSDKQKVHILEVLGKISYQYKPLLEHLRELHSKTQNDPKRAALHRAVEEALLEVNPYEQIPQ